MHSEGLVIQVDHSVLGRVIGSALKIDKLIITLGSFLVPLFFPQRQPDNNNTTNYERTSAPMVLFKDFIRQINNYQTYSICNNSESSACTQFKAIFPDHTSKNIKLCFLHSYTKLVPEDILNWDSSENIDDNDYCKLMLDASQLVMFFTADNECEKSIKCTLMDLYNNHCKNSVLYPGLPVLIESTPFANISFLNSWSHGIVSKVLKHGSGGIVTDARLVYGCEGAPIYIYEKGGKGELIGLVVQTLSWCNGEWVGFSLGLSMKHLLEEVLRLTPNDDYIPFRKLPLEQPILSQINLDNVFGSVVFVRCAHKWGSGVVIDANNGIVLTCAHVVRHAENVVWVKHSGSDYPAEVVYSTPESSARDLAVLCVKNLFGAHSLRLADDPPVLGESVYAAGHPLSTESLVNLNSSPTLSAGVVSKVSGRQGPLHTTCCTQSGLSGGALIRPPDTLLGIVVSNIKVNKTTFPDFSLSVSINDIKQTLREYLNTREPSCLKPLCLDNVSAKMEWGLMDSKL